MAAKKKLDPSTMTDEQILIQIARDNLAKYGTTIPPARTARTPVLAVVPPEPEVIRIAPRVKIDAKWFKTLKTCPHCGVEKNVGKDFGIVIRRGLESAAGWCRECRNTTNYKDKPRRNRTKSTE